MRLARAVASAPFVLVAHACERALDLIAGRPEPFEYQSRTAPILDARDTIVVKPSKEGS